MRRNDKIYVRMINARHETRHEILKTVVEPCFYHLSFLTKYIFEFCAILQNYVIDVHFYENLLTTTSMGGII